MNSNTTKHLVAIKKQVEGILEDHAFNAMELTNNLELQTEIQHHVNDPLSELLENIERILESVESGDYDDFNMEEDEEISYDIEID